MRRRTLRGSGRSGCVVEPGHATAMKNLLQTHRLAWARGVKIALEAEGIRAVVLEGYDGGGLGGLGVAVVLIEDDGRNSLGVERDLDAPCPGKPVCLEQ